VTARSPAPPLAAYCAGGGAADVSGKQYLRDRRALGVAAFLRALATAGVRSGDNGGEPDDMR
jgi:hypothetical protein